MYQTLEDLFQHIHSLVNSNRLENLFAAEHELDSLVHLHGVDALADDWRVHRMMVVENLAVLYNNIGFRYHPTILGAARQGDKEGQHLAAREAARCHGKALSLHGMQSPEDVLYLPSNHMPKVFISTFWGLGASHYFLEKPMESKRYLDLCLRLRPPDQQAVALQENARGLYAILMDERR